MKAPGFRLLLLVVVLSILLLEGTSALRRCKNSDCSEAVSLARVGKEHTTEGGEVTFKPLEVITIYSKDGDVWESVVNGNRVFFPSHIAEEIVVFDRNPAFVVPYIPPATSSVPIPEPDPEPVLPATPPSPPLASNPPPLVPSPALTSSSAPQEAQALPSQPAENDQKAAKEAKRKAMLEEKMRLLKELEDLEKEEEAKEDLPPVTTPAPPVSIEEQNPPLVEGSLPPGQVLQESALPIEDEDPNEERRRQAKREFLNKLNAGGKFGEIRKNLESELSEPAVSRVVSPETDAFPQVSAPEVIEPRVDSLLERQEKDLNQDTLRETPQVRTLESETAASNQALPHLADAKASDTPVDQVASQPQSDIPHPLPPVPVPSPPVVEEVASTLPLVEPSESTVDPKIQDKYKTECPKWANRGACDQTSKNAAWMEVNCARTCHVWRLKNQQSAQKSSTEHQTSPGDDLAIKQEMAKSFGENVVKEASEHQAQARREEEERIVREKKEMEEREARERVMAEESFARAEADLAIQQAKQKREKNAEDIRVREAERLSEEKQKLMEDSKRRREERLGSLGNLGKMLDQVEEEERLRKLNKGNNTGEASSADGPAQHESIPMAHSKLHEAVPSVGSEALKHGIEVGIHDSASRMSAMAENAGSSIDEAEPARTKPASPLEDDEDIPVVLNPSRVHLSTQNGRGVAEFDESQDADGRKIGTQSKQEEEEEHRRIQERLKHEELERLRLAQEQKAREEEALRIQEEKALEEERQLFEQQKREEEQRYLEEKRRREEEEVEQLQKKKEEEERRRVEEQKAQEAAEEEERRRLQEIKKQAEDEERRRLQEQKDREEQEKQRIQEQKDREHLRRIQEEKEREEEEQRRVAEQKKHEEELQRRLELQKKEEEEEARRIEEEKRRADEHAQRLREQQEAERQHQQQHGEEGEEEEAEEEEEAGEVKGEEKEEGGEEGKISEEMQQPQKQPEQHPQPEQQPQQHPVRKEAWVSPWADVTRTEAERAAFWRQEIAWRTEGHNFEKRKTLWTQKLAALTQPQTPEEVEQVVESEDKEVVRSGVQDLRPPESMLNDRRNRMQGHAKNNPRTTDPQHTHGTPEVGEEHQQQQQQDDQSQSSDFVSSIMETFSTYSEMTQTKATQLLEQLSEVQWDAELAFLEVNLSSYVGEVGAAVPLYQIALAAFVGFVGVLFTFARCCCCCCRGRKSSQPSTMATQQLSSPASATEKTPSAPAKPEAVKSGSKSTPPAPLLPPEQPLVLPPKIPKGQKTQILTPMPLGPDHTNSVAPSEPSTRHPDGHQNSDQKASLQLKELSHKLEVAEQKASLYATDVEQLKQENQKLKEDTAAKLADYEQTINNYHQMSTSYQQLYAYMQDLQAKYEEQASYITQTTKNQEEFAEVNAKYDELRAAAEQDKLAHSTALRELEHKLVTAESNLGERTKQLQKAQMRIKELTEASKYLSQSDAMSDYSGRTSPISKTGSPPPGGYKSSPIKPIPVRQPPPPASSPPTRPPLPAGPPPSSVLPRPPLSQPPPPALPHPSQFPASQQGRRISQPPPPPAASTLPSQLRPTQPQPPPPSSKPPAK